jgi:hypothetical protein
VSDRSVRGASVMASKALDSFSVEMSMRKDVFDNVVRFTEKFGLEDLSAEVRRYVEKRVRDGKRNGSIKKISFLKFFFFVNYFASFYGAD